MNGSRSTSPRHGDRSSLDALNRTIEGLEARIDGLLKTSRDPRRQAPPEARNHAAAPAGSSPLKAVDPLQAIRERQRALAQAREQPPRAAEPAAAPALPRPRLERQRENRPLDLPRNPSVRSAQTTAQATVQADVSLQEIAEALVSLRQELKHDIADGVEREMRALRAEVSSIRSVAQGQQIGDDLRHDLARLADGVNALGHRGGPESDALRMEYEELRAVIDGLAREDSLRHLDARWQGIEDRIVDIDTNGLREELIGLAYRIDDIKGQLGSMSNSPAIRALEQKLVAVATAMEQLGSRMQPTDELTEQFAVLDERLDEISRAIAASGRASSAPAADHAALQRLENRIGGLAEQIDTMARTHHAPTEGLSKRIEALSDRIEMLSSEEVALRLEERLEQLSHMLSQPSRMNGQDGLTEYLADISDKIDRLGDGQVNGALAERLDYLARRIDEMDYHQSLQLPANEQAAIGRIEERLSDIADRLDETVQGPIGDTSALKSLEMQIANLSELMSAGPQAGAYLAPELETRVTALETQANTNDEYIIEAARQAAEAVVESFARRERAGSPAVDTEALAALAEDLRLLEELTRSKDERSQHTLNALHATLVQIADRLDTMEDRLAPPMREMTTIQQWQTEALAGAPGQRAAAEAAAPIADHVHGDLINSLAGSTTHAGTRTTAAPIFDDSVDLTTATAAEEGDDSTVSPEAPVASAEGSAAPKASIFSQLSKRLRPAPKQTAAKPGRTVIDPAPSLDPVDMLPPERENEPLEPGSGTPDVRKILERVRASQAAAGGERAQPVADRADYIAAARRAAKAAALETDPALDGSDKGRKGKRGALTGSALSRHRRPIMMAVGAVLLVLMTLPLVKTLTAPEQVQPAPVSEDAVVTEETPAADQNSLAAPAAPVKPQALSDANSPGASEGRAAPRAVADDLSERPAEGAPTSDVMGDPQINVRAADGMASNLPRSQAQAPVEASNLVASNPASPPEAAPAEPAAPQIIVPASVGPESLTKAAEAGDPVALFEIGARYTEGRGVGVDMAEAANWYKLSADRGFAPAQYRLGNLFEKGSGIGRDLDKAIAYYSQAADAGNASAMHNLAVLNASGARGEPDYAAAVDWFKKAAELGVSDSQFNLAILYARGNGATQNLSESYKWFAIAAKGGDQDAAQKRDDVAKAMRKEQVEAARAAAESWTPQPLNDRANTIQLPDEWAGEKPMKTSSVDMEKAIRNIQAILNKNGFDAGAPDGKMGQKTIAAIKAFQTSIGQEPSGKINDALVKELLTRNS